MSRLHIGGARAVGFAALALAGAALAASNASARVSHTTGIVNGVQCDIWSWNNSHKRQRTVALKLEGHGNSGHGGYAVQMTYFRLVPTALHPDGVWRRVTVNAEQGGDGGFGYFVSHERYRNFAHGVEDTIAGRVFHRDDSPLGRGFPATASIPLGTAAAGAESFTIDYGHYGTTTPWAINPNTGLDSPPLPGTPASFAFYSIPVTTSWVFQSGRDFPRLDIALDLSQVVAPGTTTPAADLVSFDLRGPYGVMVFDNGADGVVDRVIWGDETNLFSTSQTPATRSSKWTWHAANGGARYNALVAGTGRSPHGRFEMGLFEPAPAAQSALADGYAAERGFSSAGYAAAVAAGQQSASVDSCAPQSAQRLPSDGTWPYQSLQYSLPCPPNANYLTTPTTGKKIAWGSSSYYGTSLTSVWNGFESLPINAFPADFTLRYSVCVVLAWDANGVPGSPPSNTVTAANAALYTAADPQPASSNCAETAIP